jgi:histidinol-phosphate aminotransferase
MDWTELLSPLTRAGLAAAVRDYVSKDTDEYALIEDLKRRHGLERVYRFDIGKHTDGYSDLIDGVLEEADLAGLCRQNLVEYPDNHYRLLLQRMAERYGMGPECFFISAGLESVIDHVSRAFLHPGAHFLLPVPNFSVFEDFSLRLGARPLYVELAREDGFQWTPRTVERLAAALAARRPALVWISNPVNPTGQDLPLEWVAAVVEGAFEHGAVVVVDEAYGEYTDRDEGIVSAASLLPQRPNLLVLRTFSKIHALPSLRVGYAMCSNPDIVKALELYRPMFPFSWFSLFVAQIAFVDEEHPAWARAKTARRRAELCRELEGLAGCQHLPSATNTIMLRRSGCTADRLWQELARRGCLTANLNHIRGLEGEQFLRVTVRSGEDNRRLLAALAGLGGAAA